MAEQIHKIVQCPEIGGPTGMGEAPFEGKKARENLSKRVETAWKNHDLQRK